MPKSTALPAPFTHRPALAWEHSFPGTPDQIQQVRAALRSLLEGFPLADDVIAAVNELATNAITHSNSGQPGGTFTVCLRRSSGGHIDVEVQDQGSTWHGDLARSARDQHGLHIVLALATACGSNRSDQSTIVWFRIDYPVSPGGDKLTYDADNGSLPAIPPGRRSPDDLTARIFQSLYSDFELRTLHGTHIVVPRGVPCFMGPSLSEIARQISDREHHRPDRTCPAATAVNSELGAIS
jgi:serine/threonine-protein kinase RsbW